jgi:glycosyltransferase involved in cell wall biosynthesis
MSDRAQAGHLLPTPRRLTAESLGRISVIIATFNSERTIAQAIDSFFAQTYPNKELIVVDGASRDATMDIVGRYRERIATCISEPDSGHYQAFNKGIRAATGEWIYILGSDDYLWGPDALSGIAPHLEAARAAGEQVVYGRVAFVNDAGEILMMAGTPWANARSHIRDMMTVPHQGVFQHYLLFEKHGLFNETFRMTGDYELLLRELKSHDARFAPEVVVAGYRFGGGSSVPENALKVLFEFRRAQRLNGLGRPSLYWVRIMLRTAARRVVWTLLGARRAARVDDWLRERAGLERFWTRV